MIGEQKLGEMELKELSLEEAFNKINKLENYIVFLRQEIDTISQDYNLEVFRSTELHKHLKTTIQLLKVMRGK